MFKCDVCNAQLLDDQNQKDFWVFYLFLEVSLMFWKFFSKCQILCVEKIYVWPFCDSFREWIQVVRFLGNFNFLKIAGREFRNSLTSALRLLCECLAAQHWPAKFCLVHFHISWVGSRMAHKSLTREICGKIVLKGSKFQFSKTLSFCSLRLTLLKTQNLFKNSTNLLWISIPRLL